MGVLSLGALSDTIERTFDLGCFPVIRRLLVCAAEELVELMAAHGRAESAHAQRKLAMAAELYRRRKAENATNGAWTSQQGEFVPAEIGAGLRVSRAVAAGLLHVGLSLDDRLPATKQAFARGELDYGRVRTIAERTADVNACRGRSG